MKAKDYLQEKYPALSGNRWNSNPYIDDDWVAEMMEEYARIQIEKDRDARKSDMEAAYETLPVNSDYADAQGVGLLKAIKILKTAPINLD